MKRCGIYKITNIVNEKILIGQSINMDKRWTQHKSYLRKNKHDNPHLQHAWNKYGEQSFKFDILVECSKKNLDKEEIRLINEYRSMNSNLGYNLKGGGNRPLYSEESRIKMSESRKKLLSNKENHPNYGKTLSVDTRRKISQANSGKNHPNYGNSLSQDTRHKISISKTGNKNPNYGKKLSEITRLKMSQSRKGKRLSKETIQKIQYSRLRSRLKQLYWIIYVTLQAE